ncbi:hypothetical protein B5C34_13565 [Pacificimonas flava]|uniref:EAL domain-containing protein n=2 Tax=Pacificimonas TaxID=1960290 RepID=A0A219B868_9SPHN|nr:MULTISPECIES: EAL domain-containing protein [Pacificimonas]MBZ6379851.1 EAL domain-containing protein [Pacificimonas aurantium]OWV34384.1 hypothetical protein B5C34_13565 [Pacificimonas flava]
MVERAKVLGELFDGLGDQQQRPVAPVDRLLRVIREHLDMDVAYVSEFQGDEGIFRHVDAPGFEDVIKVGDRRSLDEVYCRKIIDGRLPQLIPDTSRENEASSMPITGLVPIGAHISVPLRMSDGHIYGMFCCLNTKADPSLNERDLSLFRSFAELTAQDLSAEREQQQEREQRKAKIGNIVDAQSFDLVFQPIFHLPENRIVGYEALSRFRDPSFSGPLAAFKEAAVVGLSEELELAAIEKALRSLEEMPSDSYLAVNASERTMRNPSFAALFQGRACDRVVVEVTEHRRVQDYNDLLQAIEPLRRQGMRIAADDAGTGYSGLYHILSLGADIIKLDMELVHGIDRDPARRALSSALVTFANQIGAGLIAEGIETEAELSTVRDLGIQDVQGYLFGKPAQATELLART